MSELSDIILVPASWYIEESLFEDTIIEKTNNYNVPLVISNRGRGFYDRTKLKVYDKSIEGKYIKGEPVRGRAAIAVPRRKPVIEEHSIVRKIDI